MSDSALVLIVAIVVMATIALALWRRRDVTIIYPPMVGLLYRDGLFLRELPPGRYAFFDPFDRDRIVQVSLVERPVALPEVTVVSRDQFSFRLGLSPMMTVHDARPFAESQGSLDPQDYPASIAVVHPMLQPRLASAALAAVARHGLAELMAAPAAPLAEIQAEIANAVPGATIDSVLLTAISLPPETRRMFTEVERAKMEAQAGLERARGEQAALRVLANAARLMDGNPALATLRLLQTIEGSKGSTTIILGEGAAAGGLSMTAGRKSG